MPNVIRALPRAAVDPVSVEGITSRQDTPNSSRRRLLIALAAGAGVATTGLRAAAREPLGAEALRRGSRMRLSWAGKHVGVRILVSPDPDARRSSMRLLARSARSAQINVDAPLSPRPYFLLTDAAGAEVRVAERPLPLTGGWNFRDAGGYVTRSGKQVRWGKMYRSGVMSDLTADDLDYLRALNIKVICDLRSTEERRTAANPFLDGTGPQVTAHDYAFNDLNRSSRHPAQAYASVAGYIDATSDKYVDYASTVLVGHASEIFERLLAGDAPLAMNCSAGKDRTGIITALVLSALDVPRATVVADYALTDRYLPRSEVERMFADGGRRLGLTPQTVQALAKLPADVRSVALSAHPDVMRLALARIDQRYGGPIRLAQQKFGLDDRKVDRLRQMYTV